MTIKYVGKVFYDFFFDYILRVSQFLHTNIFHTWYSRKRRSPENPVLRQSISETKKNKLMLFIFNELAVA